MKQIFLQAPALGEVSREWGWAFENRGRTSRGVFWLFLLQVVLVWSLIWSVDQIVPYYKFPSIGILLRGLVLFAVAIITGSALLNAILRRLRDAGVSLFLPATAFVLVCFAYVFDMVHILSLDWYGLDFWSGEGLSKILEYMLQFGILSCIAATCGGLALGTKGRE